MITLQNELVLLDQHKHWTIKTLNREGSVRRYQCTIWGDGRRVTASALSPLEAITAAQAKLRAFRTRSSPAPKLKIVR